MISPSLAPHRPTASPSLFAIRLAAALLRAGAPAHRLEEAMEGFAAAWGVPVRILALPSAVLASVGEAQVSLEVATPGEPHLARLTELHALAERVAADGLSPEEALAALNAIESRPDPYGRAATVAAFTLCGAAAAPVFGGGLNELLASALTGLAAGIAAVAVPAGPLVTTVAAVAIGAIASALSTRVPLEASVPVLAGLLVFLPGLSLTVGMAELATGHRITGSSRALAAVLSLLQLGFGVALGRALTLFLGPALPAELVPLPALVEPWSLLSVAIAFTVLLRAPGWALPSIAATAVIATQSAALGGELLGPALGPAVAALAVTLWSNGLCRATRRPTALTQVPGILLLVPGSLGFRAVEALARGDSAAGVEVAFQTGLSATALVGGMLLGHALLPAIPQPSPRSTARLSSPGPANSP